MCLSRRVFVGALVSFGAFIGSNIRGAQQGAPQPQFPSPEPPELPKNQKRDRILLKANRDAIAKDVTRMSELIDALQKQLKENDTADILSLDVIRKSEEIEKLARQVRDLVRG
jgi:hypothetical protein